MGHALPRSYHGANTSVESDSMKARRPAILLATLAALAGARAQEVRITVQADQVLHPLSRYLTGACLEDVNHEVYGGLCTAR
jgi:hypothetical protein